MTHLEAMRIAIAKGHRGAGFVSPNPMVGCVILDKNQQMIGHGFHARVGEGHAEVQALNSIAEASSLEGAHLFVTLEPCAHDGRTPSCAKALAKLPIAAVTYGLQDPNPMVSGEGAAILERAGKRVEKFSELRVELEELGEIFFMNMRSRRPFVALKTATSLDGKIALPDGRSQWITGEQARAKVHELRGAYDAVLTGLGTFLKDNPRLNSRTACFSAKRQKVILLDPKGDSLKRMAGSELYKVRKPEDILLVTEKAIETDTDVQQLILLSGTQGFSIEELLSMLYEKGITSIFVEAGAETNAAFLRAKLVDRLYNFVAPKILGQGLTWSGRFELTSLEEAPLLTNVRYESFGADLLITGRLTT